MLKIREAIVVEGRYDKIALEPLVDTEIFTTDGFGIFRDAEKLALLRAVAEKRGLIVLTDADGAGLVIRNRLRGCIGDAWLRHAYIPDVPGKERRKIKPSRAGTLGVEGMAPEVLRLALERAGATPREDERPRVTKADLYAAGLSGARDASARRRALQKALGLPANLSANALLDALNSLYSREEFLSAAAALEKAGGEIARDQDAGGV
ncbi:MAG: DUF4093 domain-containing protein [Oscillospiraceae bacterium]|nr:DUF4093 domain-containing protein [Oscillospiraceae bacterium]